MNRRDAWGLYRELVRTKDEAAENITVLGELAEAARMIRSDAETSKSWESELDDCIHAAASHPPTFARALVEWLKSDEDVPTAKLLARKASVVNFRASAPLQYDLRTADRDDALLAGMRLCSMFVAPSLSLGWAMSLVEANPAGEGLQVTAGLGALLVYHAEEFPVTTKHLLESETSPFKALPAAQQLLEGLRTAQSQLDEMPFLREFTMTPEMRLVYAGVKRTEQREIQRGARAGSIFAQLATTQHFKYSNRTAVEMRIGDKVKETTLAMSSFQYGYELPVSERVDPVRGKFRRAGFWNGEFQ